MLGTLLQRTSTCPVSTSIGLSREAATRKGLRYKTWPVRACMSGEIMHPRHEMANGELHHYKGKTDK